MRLKYKVYFKEYSNKKKKRRKKIISPSDKRLAAKSADQGSEFQNRDSAPKKYSVRHKGHKKDALKSPIKEKKRET